MVQTDTLPVKLCARAFDSSIAEFTDEIPMQLVANVFDSGIVFDNQWFLHVSFLSLWFQEHTHESAVVVNEILEILKANSFEG